MSCGLVSLVLPFCLITFEYILEFSSDWTIGIDLFGSIQIFRNTT